MTCLFSGAMGLLYTPFMKIVVSAFPIEKVGTGLGFFNLSISIASTIWVAITGKLLSISFLHKTNLFGFETSSAPLYSDILLIYVVLITIGLGLYYINKNTLSFKEND